MAAELLARDDAYSVDGSTLRIAAPGILVNDQFGPAVRTQLVSEPAHGTVSIEADGSFRYVADPGYYGYDRFQYSLTGPGATTSLGTVTVDVTLTLPGGAVLRDPSSDPFTLTASLTDEVAIELTTADLISASFEWLVPSVALTVPGLLLVGIILAQGAGALIWLPLIRRFRKGMTLRRAGMRG